MDPKELKKLYEEAFDRVVEIEKNFQDKPSLRIQEIEKIIIELVKKQTEGNK